MDASRPIRVATTAQFVEQTQRFGVQIPKTTAEHNAQMEKLIAEHRKEVARLTGQGPVAKIESKR